MARSEPANPIVWMLVQVVEFIAVIALLQRILPDSRAGWPQVVVFAVVLVGVFLLNLYVVMPSIDRTRSRSEPGDDGSEP